MAKRFIAVLISACFFAPVANAQEIAPRFKQILSIYDAQRKGTCPYISVGTDMGPSMSFRRDTSKTKEFINLRYYPMYDMVTLAVHTTGGRFENKCREAAVGFIAKTAELDSGTFAECPGKEPDDLVETYGFANGKLVGEDLKPAWQKRAEEYLAEVESVVALCK